MAERIAYLTGTEHYSEKELWKLGYYLTESQLSEMGLTDAIRRAEVRIAGRWMNVLESLRALSEALPEEYISKARVAAQQAENPGRGRAQQMGETSQAWGRRSLPKPGTLISVRHYFMAHSETKILRFAVVEQPDKLVWLDEEVYRIYNNPSVASEASAGDRTGWRFFGVTYNDPSTHTTRLNEADYGQN